ncbi:hypothetical protein KSP35_10665 [Aquihabitans sp. G128]|uniref:hypothetical protein n=1 Tax=Aquihabitans sp. G128 TaxID=2849779 RepID=UPI001C226765|nr:hypothetical protein [Aquihabitans sp. G128]QXC63200.1 hypothetical protein KSP35_10665 [Aquihabitans sp. G128]
MPATPIRRRTRSAAPFAGVLLAIALLAGCAGQKAPGSYTSGVRKDFIEGCWTTLVRDDQGAEAAKLSADQLEAKYGDAAKAATKGCTCAYNAFKDDLKFGDFKKLNDNETETPKALEAKVTKIYADCTLTASTESS